MICPVEIASDMSAFRAVVGDHAKHELLHRSRHGAGYESTGSDVAGHVLGLPVVGWHSFRHTHATLLGEVGEPLRTAQAILGHSDPKTTLNVYTHAIPESQKRAVGKVAAYCSP